MSLWQFSEDSQPLFLRCIEATTIDANNIWVQKFGIKSRYNKRKDEFLEADLGIEPKIEDIATEYTDITHGHEEFHSEILNLDPIRSFDYITERCSEDPSLFSVLAERLPLVSVERLCKHIYVTSDIHPTFVESFYNNFLPTFVKREPTRYFYSLLIEAKCYPHYFTHMLVNITRDIDIPCNVLNDFITTLDSDEQATYLLSLHEYNITNEVFVHHLPTIVTAYKNCQKTNNLQNYIVSKLKQISQNCSTDKNYAKLLINVLKTHKEFPINISEIEIIVQNHRTAFKKTCLNILQDIVNNS